MNRFFDLLRRLLWRTVYFLDTVKYARKLGIKVGKNTKFVKCPSFSSEPWLISIGNNCYVSSDVAFVTHDGGRWVLDHLFPDSAPFYKIGKITIDDNVFIGMRTMILPNVHISKNCVIGGGSVVCKNIPEGQVWAGVPARYICSIEEYKEKMLMYRKDINWTAYWTNKEKEIKRVFEID